VPVPALAEVAGMSKPDVEFANSSVTLLPQAQAAPAETEGRLIIAARVASILPEGADWVAHRQRTLEIRDFVRSAPKPEINLKPAGETELPSFTEPFKIALQPYAAEPASALAQEPSSDFPPLVVEFVEFARADFEPTAWGETVAGEVADQELTAEEMEQEGIPTMESSRMEPVRVDPVRFESARPQPFQFEPVKIDPVFMERTTAKPDAANQSATPAASEAEPTEPTPAETASRPIPEAVTRPEPVTLHGIAPSRGKSLQVFASALAREAEIQSPRQNSLPLRPVMVLGPVDSSAAETLEKSAPEKATAEKQDPRNLNPKRKSDVRVLSLPTKTPAKVENPKPALVKSSEPKPVEAASAEPKPATAKAAEPKPVESKPAESKSANEKPAEPQKPPSKKDDVRKPAALAPELAPVAEAPHHPAPINPAPPIPDLLGLPTLSLENPSFWSRIPTAVRLGIIAAVIAAGGAGVFLTSRGSGAMPGKTTQEVVVEDGPPLATTAGWIQDWFTDPKGSKVARHVDVLRGSLAMHDYRVELEGQIDRGAIGWVFRANNKNFYAEKIALVTPGLDPAIALVHIAVVDGQEVVREEHPLKLKVHVDTQYKIRLDVVGHRFTTWVQDQQVDEWNDARIDAGGVGLYYDAGDSAHLKGSLNVVPLKIK